MNKTRKRAIQKHRAKEAKFDARHKSEVEQESAKPKGAVTQAATTARARTSSRRQAADQGE